jgi:hypothetical protein
MVVWTCMFLPIGCGRFLLQVVVTSRPVAPSSQTRLTRDTWGGAYVAACVYDPIPRCHAPGQTLPSGPSGPRAGEPIGVGHAGHPQVGDPPDAGVQLPGRSRVPAIEETSGNYSLRPSHRVCWAQEAAPVTALHVSQIATSCWRPVGPSLPAQRRRMKVKCSRRRLPPVRR